MLLYLPPGGRRASALSGRRVRTSEHPQGQSSLRAQAPLSTSRPRALPAVTSGSRGPACTPTKPRAASGLGRKARQPSGGGVTTEGTPMDSRTWMEKACEMKFTTATSGGREHATGLRAAATFSASPAPPRQARPLSPRPRRPAARVAAPGDAGKRTRARAAGAGPRNRARSRAGRTSLRVRQRWGARAQTTQVPRARVSPSTRSGPSFAVPSPCLRTAGTD